MDCFGIPAKTTLTWKRRCATLNVWLPLYFDVLSFGGISMSEEFWYYVLVYSVIFGFTCCTIEKNKGYRDGEAWLIWGFLFGVFALIAVCAKPAKVEKETNISSHNRISQMRASRKSHTPTFPVSSIVPTATPPTTAHGCRG